MTFCQRHAYLTFLGLLFVVVDLRSEEIPADTAILDVHAPADAKLHINGDDMKEQRRLRFSGIRPGQVQDKEVKVVFADGREVRRTLQLSGGTEAALSYTALLVNPQASIPIEQIDELMDRREVVLQEIQKSQAQTQGIAVQALLRLAEIDRRIVANFELFETKLFQRDQILKRFRNELDAVLLELVNERLTNRQANEAKPMLEELASIRRLLHGDDSKEFAEAAAALKSLNAQRQAQTPGSTPNPSPASQSRLAEAERLSAQVEQLYRQGRASEALPLAKQALAIHKDVLGEKHADTAHSLNNLAILHQAMRDFVDAKSCYEQALAINREVLGEKHPNTASGLNNLGVLLKTTGDYAGAQPYYEQALAISKEVLGNKHPDTAQSLDNLAALRQAMGDYGTARTYYEQALAIYKEVLGDKHPETARSLNNLGVLLQAMGDHAGARTNFERALAIRKSALGERHPDTATSLNNLGSLLAAMGDIAGARRYCEQAVAIRKEVLGDKHPDTASSLNSIGFVLREMGDYAAARSCFEQALAINQEVLGEKHPDTASSLINMGALLQAMGDHAAARRYYEQALAINSAVLGDKHPDTAPSLNSMGNLLKDMGDYAAARSYYEQALAINKQSLGDKHPRTAAALSNLALLLQDIGDHAGARRYYEQSLAIRREVLGDKHVDTASCLNNLGLLLYSIGDNAGARSCYEQALAINKEVLGDNHPDTATILNNIGLLLDSMGDYSGARPYYEQSLAIKKEALGDKHPEIAVSLSNLGALLQEMGDIAGARRYYEQALAIRKEVLGDKHPKTALSLSNVGGLFASAGELQSASTTIGEARRIVRRHVARNLPAMSDREQLAFLQASDEAQFHSALSLGILARQDADISGRSAAWLLNGKAVAIEALTQRNLLARQSTDPQAAALVQQLDAIRERLAKVAVATPTLNRVEQHRRQLAELENEEADVIRKLGQFGVDPRLPDPSVELADVQKSLPSDSVFINIAKFRPFDFATTKRSERWRPARYVAWIIPPNQGLVQIVDLGDASAIDAAVADFQSLIQPDAVSRSLQSGGEKVAEAAVHAKLTAIAEKVLWPLESLIGQTPRWVISADGALWLAPWAALPMSDGRYAIESHLVSYLTSGRELAVRPTEQNKSESLVVANPDYGSEPGASGDLRGAMVAGRGASRTLSEIHWPALSGTAEEAKAILPSVSAYLGDTPIVFSSAEATEGRVKQAKRPRVAIFMTHGFYLPDMKIAPDERTGLTEFDQRPSAMAAKLENPLLRCGLVFAGANRHTPADGSSDDGILTGLEIAGADFRGTELVVLSACETGLGDVNSGEGVAGLRQAFLLSGAKGVLATLWQIPDQETVQLMTGFWNDFADGLSAAEALREAQLAIIRDRRSKFGAAHPIYWAAFTYTGAVEDNRTTAAKVEVIVDTTKLYDGSDVITEAKKGQIVSIDPADKTEHYYLANLTINGQRRKLWLLKTDTRPIHRNLFAQPTTTVSSAPSTTSNNVDTSPAAAVGAALDFGAALDGMVAEIVPYLKSKGKSSVSLGQFSCATPQLQAAGGPAIANAVAARLQSQGIEPKRRAEFGLKGEYRFLVPTTRGVVRKSPAVQLDCQLVDNSGQSVLSLRRQVASVETLAALLGFTANLAPSKATGDRDKNITDAIAGPTVSLEGSTVRSHSDSPYSVEILVKGANGYQSLAARNEEGMAFVDIPKDSLYAVRVINHSGHDASVTLTIDGLNMFAFSANKAYSYFILGKGASADISGWHRSNEKSDSFRITDYGQGAAAELLSNPSDVGTITLTIAAAWPEGSPPPVDEPIVDLASRGASVATGRGPQIGANYVEQQRHIGQIRDIISVRYSK